jgi:hypothetical protein
MKPWNSPQILSENKASHPSTIGAINRMPDAQKRAIYAKIIPEKLREVFHLKPDLLDEEGRDLFVLNGPKDSTSVEISLYHQYGFIDPVLYGHITDTINAQIHILFYVMNDPFSPRFEIDQLPDGRQTQLGSKHRHIEAEVEAMYAGLSPGQIRKGPHLLKAAMETFETFIQSLDHDLHFAEPLFYHNAVIFEKYGFAYQRGRRLMQRIQEGFSRGGDLHALLEGSNPFRQPQAANSIRLRSWAIHDGILGEQFQNVTMYKQVGKHAGFSTCVDCGW